MSTKVINSFVLAVTITFSSVTAFAIRSVGNGGGLAEMRVVYLFQNLDRFLRVCLTPANVCTIANDTYVDWIKIYSEKPSDQNDYLVSFVNDLTDVNGFVLEGMNLKISHKMLYVDLKTPKSFGDLLAFVISVKQDLMASRLSFQENLQIASAIFKDLKIEELNYKADGASSLLSLSQLKVFDGVSKHLVMGLEDEEKTVNLSETLEKALPCGDLTEWTFNQWSSSVFSKTVYFYGSASAVCNLKHVEKRIMIKAALTTKFLVDEKSITANFFAQ